MAINLLIIILSMNQYKSMDISINTKIQCFNGTIEDCLNFTGNNSLITNNITNPIINLNTIKDFDNTTNMANNISSMDNRFLSPPSLQNPMFNS